VNKLVLICVLAGVVAAAAVLAWAAWRKPARGTVQSYGEVRRQIIGQRGGATARSAPSVRPAGLDGRLGRDALTRLRRADPWTKENSLERFQAYVAIVNSIDDEHGAIDPGHGSYQLISPGRRAVLIADRFEAEVNNGGFDQYFLNTSGNGAALAPESLRLLGLGQVAELVERANAQFPGGPSPDRGTRLEQMDRLPDSARKVWEELGDKFYDLDTSPGGSAENNGIKYILAHEEEFFRSP
jgi:Domain of unknown function (DUF4375)